jgi:ABC-type Co2+ transport system permease subunit
MFDDAMNPEAEAERELDARIVEQLERLPDLSAIPADFAARVAAKVPVRRPVSVRTTHYGRTLMMFGLVVLFVALVVLAKHSFTTSPIGVALEWTLCIQFLAFAVWMGVQHFRSN